MTILDSTTLSVAGLEENGSVADAVSTRANVFDMTHAAEMAVLRPHDCGAFDHDMRAALAARMAMQANDPDLSAHYANGAGALSALADPSQDGGAHAMVIAFVDKAANATRDISAEDIAGLQAAGISDPDIVRLCELVAFVAYQIRVIAGLRLMQETSA